MNFFKYNIQKKWHEKKDLHGFDLSHRQKMSPLQHENLIPFLSSDIIVLSRCIAFMFHFYGFRHIEIVIFWTVTSNKDLLTIQEHQISFRLKLMRKV